MTEQTTVPAWPLYRLDADETGAVTITGPAIAPGPYPTRTAALQAVTTHAATVLRPPRPVRIDAVDSDGTAWPLYAHPDGTVTEAGPPRRTRKTSKKRPAPPAPPSPAPNAPMPAAAQVVEQPCTPAAPPAPCSPADEHEATQHGPIPTTLVIQRYAAAGDLTTAVNLAAQLDEATSDAHGPSHPDALQARELRGELMAALGELAAAVDVLRDVAERWWHSGHRDDADRAAARAHAVWLTITDLTAATQAGRSILRMRSHLPGPDGTAYHQAQARQAELEAAAIRGSTQVAEC
ncbi:hypothetical protein [Streptomyces synnematoformans]|uniref:Tetratricopeptide repeat protein n=1 Tax=Streptomyces synnematoformans TaxID=415721 RepID=A0ABP5J6E4_9ACTN